MSEIGYMTADSDTPTHGALGRRLGALVVGFEPVIYAVAFLLLVISAVLVVIGSADAVVAAVTRRVDAIDGGVLILDRVLLVLIVAELAYTLRTVLQYRQIAAEPFLLIGLIAAVRRILIVTAAFEQNPTGDELTRLLYELGALGLLVLTVAAAIFLLRFSSRYKPTAQPGQP
ncbi:hypothetical protein KIH27_04545 [Mycobacterium sp. M1]|uniref:Phosphate-starvation-inducible E n=1 Tax=Mycolicibacter acidiphilus TaxID=2835306 RepID=A0ABS5REZ6_9MYCO|nr:phosphate-starvation-inducible PsiE family protein [Mycolicibacter acidiphilus]MBS9532855.1 hypothetical protein [Mycolicibacter acidiphilus]